METVIQYTYKLTRHITYTHAQSQVNRLVSYFVVVCLCACPSSAEPIYLHYIAYIHEKLVMSLNTVSIFSL